MNNVKKMSTTDSQRLALAVARLGRRLRQERRSELTPTQISMLGSLRLLGPSTPSTLAARERVSAPAVTRILKVLVEAGLVDKEPHPEDGRQVVVSLSQLGEKTLAEERHRRDEWLERRLRAMDARERAVLREAAAILDRIAES